MRLAIVFGFIVSVFAPHLFAQSYDSLIRHDLGAVEDLSPQVVVATRDGGHWISAQHPRDESAYQLVHLDANGNRLAGLHFSQGRSYEGYSESLYPLADQGVLVVHDEEYSCTIRRLSSDGSIKFERISYARECSVTISATESNFLVDSEYGVALLAEDGSQISKISPRAENIRFKEVKFAGTGPELMILQNTADQLGFELVRVSGAGQQLWRTPVQNARYEPQRSRYIAMHALRNGRAVVVFPTQDGLDFALYDASGQLLGTQPLANPANSQFFDMYDWAIDDLGNIALNLSFLQTDQGGVRKTEFIVLSSDGLLSKRVQVTPDDACRDSCELLGLASGFAHLKTENFFTEHQEQKLVIISPDPNVDVIVRALDYASTPILSGGKNGSILALSSDSHKVKTLRAFDAKGLEIQAPSLLAKGKTQPEIDESFIADDGKSFVTQYTPEGNGGVVRLLVYAANGAELWKKIISGSTMLANANRVCLSKLESDRITLVCYRSDNGLEIVNTSVAVNQDARYRAGFLADGRLRLVYADPNLKVLDVATDNQISQFSVAISTANIVDLGTTGSVLLTNGSGVSAVKDLVLVQPSGTIAYRRPLPSDTYNVYGKLLPNNSALLYISTQNFDEEPPVVALVDAAGVQVWNIAPTQAQETLFPSELFADENYVYICYRFRVAFPYIRFANSPLQIRAFSRIDGHLVWTKEFEQNGYSSVGLYAGANPSELLVSANHELGTEMSRLASATGAVLERRMLSCESAKCSTEASALDHNQEFRTITLASDPGHESLVLARAATANTPPTIALDQPGLSGAWYTPQIGGQGFFLEYFPQSKLLFAPWFTFSNYYTSGVGEELNSNSAANLRWYTLSGTVESNAKTTRLDIRRSYAGVFDSAPATSSTVVGTATLRAQDCNRATLEFEFFDGESNTLEPGPDPGKYGVLPLDRLTGGSAPCQLSNGQMQPGRDARPAFGGFDNRQSGSWYQPTTAGQGLMMTVQPATASAPGFFFGGWFTYDAVTPNDPTSQHWLTLSGEIPVNAQSGVVPVAIYRTLGGQLAGVPTQNNAILGHGTVTFTGCESAILRYQFDDALIVGAFKARSGQINLSRLGACPAQ